MKLWRIRRDDGEVTPATPDDINRMAGHLDITAEYALTGLENGAVKLLSFATPPAARDFMRDFDNHETVESFAFELGESLL